MVDFCTEICVWDMEVIGDLFPSHIVKEMEDVQIVMDETEREEVAWWCTSDGRFTVKLAYRELVGVSKDIDSLI